MNTSQLLLVSSLGLAVNLFGMFAMGGHHHVGLFFTVQEFTDQGAGRTFSLPRPLSWPLSLSK
jgi:Co/Zn/Cd efflux system component